MATKKEIYTKKSDGSLQFVGYLPTEDVVSALTYTTDIGNINTRLTTAETAIADRYTKGEVDGKVDSKIPLNGYAQAYGYWGEGKYRYCLVAKIKIATTWQSLDLCFDYGGNGNITNTVIVHIAVTSSLTSGYTFQIYSYAQTDYAFYLKDLGNGEAEVYCDMTGEQGFIYIERLYGRALALHQITMTMTGATSLPDGSVSAQPKLWGDYASSSNKANYVYFPRDHYFNPDIPGLSNELVGFKETPLGGSIGNLNCNWWHIMTMASTDGNYFTQLGLMMADGSGMKQTPYLAFRNHTWQGWNDWAIAISDKTIGQQVVKSFTATEVDHGCKFNGDLSSTTLVSSPLHMAVSEFNTSEANSPTAPRTLTGNIEVTFGSAKKTIANMKYNPFMAYFFDHGYHFSAVKEGGDDTLYDKGIVTYGQFIYYCVYTYHSDGSDAFDSAIIMTDDTTEMSKYVMYESGKAKDLMIEGNYIYTDGLKKVNIQEKAGTLALKSDIPSVPSVVDNLTSTSSYSALSAYQGKVLNDKINGIKFSQLATGSLIGGIGLSNSRGDEDLTYSAHLSGGSKGGRFYVISGLENGYNSDYGKLVVKTSSNGKADMTTNAVAGVSGETGYWNPQWLSVSVFVPAGKDYYLWGCRINKVYYSCAELSK